MSVTPPSATTPAGTPQSAYAVPPHVPLGGPATPPAGARESRRPSWVAWTALGLSALSFVVATSVGVVLAAQTLSGDSSEEPLEEGLYYDAGMPVWGEVALAPSGAATERILTDSLEEALRTGIEDYDGSADDIGDVYCEALTAPRKDSVATCSATIADVESTVVLFFTDDDGSYVATVY